MKSVTVCCRRMMAVYDFMEKNLRASCIAVISFWLVIKAGDFSISYSGKESHSRMHLASYYAELQLYTSHGKFALKVFLLEFSIIVSDFSMVLRTEPFTSWCVFSCVSSKRSARQLSQRPASRSWPTRFRTTSLLYLWVGNKMAAAVF